MLSWPLAFRSAIGVFAPVFSRPVWQHVQGLLTGAVLAPGKRTVSAILQSMGRRAAPEYQTYHRVLHRAVWSPLTASRLLLRLFGAVCVPRGGVRCGLADTIERRRGEHSAAQGLYRAPVRSSHAPFGKVSGLRWRGGMLLPPMPWAHRLWALPWMTVLGPSERFDAQRGRRQHTLLERAWPSIRLVRRWWPGRALVFVADRRCAARDWLALGERFPRVSVITRLRLDAALY
jgi:hypothetical protein